jgi:hypothetical protein
MSLFSSIGKALSNIAAPFLGASKLAQPVLQTVSKVPLLGTALKAIPGIGTAVTVGSIALPAITAALKKPAVSAAGKVIAGVAGGAAAGAAVQHFTSNGMVPAGYHVSKTSGRIVRNRRMNVCNMKAARRATRRIKGARKALQRIEKALPHRTTHHRGTARGGRTIESIAVRN